MNKQRTSLYIGRFQPFHLGHLDAVRQIQEDGKTDLLIIGIGSAETDFVPDNPFTAGERFQMIYESLIEAGIPADFFQICPLRNIDHYGLWPHHISLLTPPFAQVYSGSPLIRRLFRGMAEITPLELKDRTGISATRARAAIRTGIDLSKLLPPPVIRQLNTLAAKQRLSDIEQTSLRP